MVLEKEDEMDCLVHGANFLLQAIRDEAFTFIDGKQTFVPITAGASLDSPIIPGKQTRHGRSYSPSQGLTV